MIKKLRIKMVCIQMITFALLLFLVMGMLVAVTKQNMTRESIEEMQKIAQMPNDLPNRVRPGEQEDDSSWRGIFALSVSADGSISTAGNSYYDLSDENLLQSLMDAAAASGGESGVLKEYDLRYLIVRSPIGDKTVFADMGAENHMLSLLVRMLIFVFLMAMVAFFLISVLLARWSVKPVEKAWTQQKQFISDASHELKTPLTVIMTNTEMLADDTYTTEQKRNFVSSIQEMSSKMRDLVESMLELARTDMDIRDIVMSQMSLSKAVNDAALPFEPVFFEKDLILEEHIEDGIRIKGNETEMKQLVGILLDNAQKYCYPNTTTTLTLTKQGKQAKLSVADVGEPILKEDREKIFRRFYRVDQARGMNHSYGLGLSIAQKIVQNHRGKITVESENGVNTFAVTLRAL